MFAVHLLAYLIMRFVLKRNPEIFSQHASCVTQVAYITTASCITPLRPPSCVPAQCYVRSRQHSVGSTQ